jgi:hypothetical protein
MSAEVSEKALPAGIEPDPPLEAERDEHETRLDYGHGGVPRIVIAAWVALLTAYVIYMAFYALPDLSSWGMP